MYWTLIKAGVLRKKVRSVLTVLSVSIAFLLFGLLQAASPIFTGQMDGLRADLVMTMSRYSMVGKIPYSHVEFIKEIEEVESVLYMDYITSVSQDSMLDGITVAMGGDIEIYERFKISNEDLKAFRNLKIGALVGEAFAIEKDISIGDRVFVKSLSMNADGTYDWEFEVVGLYNSSPKADEMGIVVNYDYFEDSRISDKGTVAVIVSKVSNPEFADVISQKIDDEFTNSSWATRSGPESQLAASMMAEFGDIELIINAILSAVFFTILLVTGNTISQSVRERTTDLAVLKTLGYQDNQIFIMVLLEALFLILLGVFTGLGMSLLSIPAINAASGGLMEGLFFLTTEKLLLACFIGVLVSFVSSIMPAYKALNLKVVDALRSD
jgi:putative ABC transport system permease protein|tara:strand:+ start:525 stop:1670 length:1146 start_codon:yes stop_codon:yes gene_type:complete